MNPSHKRAYFLALQAPVLGCLQPHHKVLVIVNDLQSNKQKQTETFLHKDDMFEFLNLRVQKSMEAGGRERLRRATVQSDATVRF